MVAHTFRNTSYASIAARIPDLMNYARARCASATAAEDLVEECVVRALTSTSHFHSDRELNAWLFTIIHNLCVAQPDFDASGATMNAAEAQPKQQHATYNRLLLRALAKAAMTMPAHKRLTMENLTSGARRDGLDACSSEINLRPTPSRMLH